MTPATPESPRPRRAIFLDRDGVIIEDAGLLTSAEEIHVLPGVPGALRKLQQAGFALVVISNQAVVARGLLTQIQVAELELAIEAKLDTRLDGFYFCPHHPMATLPEYRAQCDCRKPRPGLILQAARELSLDLPGSFMVGDRPSDLLAGSRAGCQTIWVQTGQHAADPIQTGEELAPLPEPDHICGGLPEAAAWILERA